MRKFRGLLDSIYKKFELYLFRLFQLSIYVENTIKYSKLDSPNLTDILDPYGYSDDVIIPPNPFIIKEEHWKLFNQIFTEFECNSDNDKQLRKLHRQIWTRINEIKTFLGITKFTRFIGEENSDKRLVNEIDVYLVYPDSLTQVHRLVLGEFPEEESEYDKFETKLKQFQNFLLDRDRVRGVKSYQYYNN